MRVAFASTRSLPGHARAARGRPMPRVERDVARRSAADTTTVPGVVTQKFAADTKNTWTDDADTLEAKYTWDQLQLISGQDSEVTREVVYTLGHTIKYDTVSNKITNLKAAMDAGFKSSASIKLEVLSVSEEVSLSTHLEAMTHIETAVTKKQDDTETMSDKTTIVVPRGGTSRVFQCVLIMPGATFPTRSILALPTNAAAPHNVTVTYKVATSVDLSSCELVIGQLFKTRPSRDNVNEWRSIRDKISENNDKTMVQQIDALIALFSTIKPGSSNTSEWEYIRTKCDEITPAKQTDPLKRINTFFLTLDQTRPGRDNTEEWARIRRVCTDWANANGNGALFSY